MRLTLNGEPVDPAAVLRAASPGCGGRNIQAHQLAEFMLSDRGWRDLCSFWIIRYGGEPAEVDS